MTLGDGTLSDRATTELAQPYRRMTRSMTKNPRLGQVQLIVSASEPLIPHRITRSRAHIIEPEHQLFSLLLSSLD